jgi:hypothetical protein
MIENFKRLYDSVRNIHRDAAYRLQGLTSASLIFAPTLTDADALSEWHGDVLKELDHTEHVLARLRQRTLLQQALASLANRFRPPIIDESRLTERCDELRRLLSQESLGREVPTDGYGRIAAHNARQVKSFNAEQLTAATRRAGLEKVVDAAKTLEKTLKEEFMGGIRNSRSFTANFNVGLERVLRAVGDGDQSLALATLRKLPVRREMTVEQQAVFTSFAREVHTSWQNRENRGIHSADGHPGVRLNAVADARRYSRFTPFPSDFETMEEILHRPGVVTRDVQALLYWLASKAELVTYDRVPTTGIERDFNRGLPDRLCDLALNEAPRLFQALGYDGDFPFEIGYFDIDRKVEETYSGADLAIIIHVVLETDESLTRAGLFQVKPAKNNMASVLSNESRPLGRNHQLIALSDAGSCAHYLFYRDPPTTVGVTSRPVPSVLAEIRKKMTPGQHLWDLTGNQGKVSSVEGATGFASMIGFRLFDDAHAFGSVSDALEKMGRPRTGFERGAGKPTHIGMAERLVLFTIGSRISPADQLKLEGMNFKRRAPVGYDPDRPLKI